MPKATVTRFFIGGALAVIGGAVLDIAAVWIAIANDVFVMNGPDIVGLRGDGFAWPLLGLGIVGGLTIMAGVLAGLVSWIGALLNTSQVESKAWFIGILLLGVFSFGFIAMIAYVIAGPDGTTDAGTRRTRVPAHG